MPAPSTAGPPYAPTRASGWPVRRAPRWLIPAVVVLLAVAVAVGLTHRPTRPERASDLRGFLQAVTADIESCAGGVHDSLSALRAIDSGTSHDVATAVSIADTGAANCSPANNELIDDLENYQVDESLASFHLQNAVAGLIDWAAPDAEQAQADVAAVLRARGTPGEAGARARMQRDFRQLDDQRAVVSREITPAIKSLSPGAAAPALPG